jgi:ankyrin repeat protein
MKDNLLLATDRLGYTAWHLAVSNGRQDVMQKLWEMAKKSITTEEIKINIY